MTKWAPCLLFWTLVLCGCTANQRARPLCGRHLADALAQACQGRGYREMRKRLDFRTKDCQNGTECQTKVETQDLSEWRPVRIKRYIVEECCRRSCSRSKLQSYCAEQPLERQNETTPSPRRAHSPAERQRFSDNRRNPFFFYVTPSRRQYRFTRHS